MVRDNRSSQTAVTLLATTLVLLGGLTAVTFIIVSSDNDPFPKVAGVAAGTAGLALLMWLLREKPPGHVAKAQWGWFRGRAISKSVVRVGIKRSDLQAPPPAPPTAEQIHELSQNTNTWVPSSRPRREA